MLKVQSSLIISALGLMFVPLVAHADTTYDLTISGTGSTKYCASFGECAFTLSAVVTGHVDATNASEIDLTGGSGTMDFNGVTTNISLYTGGSPDSSGNGYDNIVIPGATFELDTAGLDFVDPAGQGYGYDQFWQAEPLPPGTNHYSDALASAAEGNDGGGDPSAVTSFTFTVAPTPEPSSLMLLGTGILGVAGAARRRFFKK